MGCSASSSAALSQPDVNAKKETTQVMDKYSNKDKNTGRGKKESVYSSKERDSDTLTSKTAIRLSTKTPKEPVPPEKAVPGHEGTSGMSKKVHKGKKHSLKDNKSQSPYSKDLTKELPAVKPPCTGKSTDFHKRNNISAKKTDNEKISSEKVTEIKISTKTPKETLPPLKLSPTTLTSSQNDEKEGNKIITSQVPSPPKGPNPNTQGKSSATVASGKGSVSSSKPETISKPEPLAAIPVNIEEKAALETSNDPVNAIVEVKQSDIDSKNEEEIENIPQKDPDDVVNPDNKLQEEDGKERAKSATQVSMVITQPSPDISSTGRSRPHSGGHHHHHHHHHPHHHHHHSHHHHHGKHNNGTNAKPSTPEKAIKITSKDEKTQFVFKAVKSKDEPDDGESDTKDIIIQTDVISLNDNNEKTKRKLLIKMRKMGSKSSSSSLRVTRPRQTSEKRKEKEKENKKEKEEKEKAQQAVMEEKGPVMEADQSVSVIPHLRSVTDNTGRRAQAQMADRFKKVRVPSLIKFVSQYY